MTISLNALVDCDGRWKAAVAGAGAAYLGADLYVPAPSYATFAAAGVGIDLWCKGGEMSPIQEMAGCALGGYVGGMAMRAVASSGALPRLVTGPLLVPR
tara:strand:- start:355 stop:651 length:297 start_codon:yes stop_codon:yes gene_type:complete